MVYPIKIGSKGGNSRRRRAKICVRTFHPRNFCPFQLDEKCWAAGLLQEEVDKLEGLLGEVVAKNKTVEDEMEAAFQDLKNM